MIVTLTHLTAGQLGRGGAAPAAATAELVVLLGFAAPAYHEVALGCCVGAYAS